jgi:hypothetical protein
MHDICHWCQMYQDIINAKYIKGCVVSSVKHRLSDPPVWTHLLKVEHIHLRGRQTMVKNGKRTLFWEDKQAPVYLISSSLWALRWKIHLSLQISIISTRAGNCLSNIENHRLIRFIKFISRISTICKTRFYLIPLNANTFLYDKAKL